MGLELIYAHSLLHTSSCHIFSSYMCIPRELEAPALQKEVCKMTICWSFIPSWLVHRLQNWKKICDYFRHDLSDMYTFNPWACGCRTLEYIYWLNRSLMPMHVKTTRLRRMLKFDASLPNLSAKKFWFPYTSIQANYVTH